MGGKGSQGSGLSVLCVCCVSGGVCVCACVRCKLGSRAADERRCDSRKVATAAATAAEAPCSVTGGKSCSHSQISFSLSESFGEIVAIISPKKSFFFNCTQISLFSPVTSPLFS